MYEIIRRLCKERGTTVTAMERELGYAKGSTCKMDTHEPSAKKLESIAGFLGVSVAYLRTGIEPEIPTEVDPDSIELIELYSKLKKEQKAAVLNLLRTFAL